MRFFGKENVKQHALYNTYAHSLQPLRVCLENVVQQHIITASSPIRSPVDVDRGSSSPALTSGQKAYIDFSSGGVVISDERSPASKANGGYYPCFRFASELKESLFSSFQKFVRNRRQSREDRRHKSGRIPAEPKAKHAREFA